MARAARAGTIDVSASAVRVALMPKVAEPKKVRERNSRSARCPRRPMASSNLWSSQVPIAAAKATAKEYQGSPRTTRPITAGPSRRAVKARLRSTAYW